MTEDKGSMFVVYTVIAMVHIYYDGVILVLIIVYYTIIMFSTHYISAK